MDAMGEFGSFFCSGGDAGIVVGLPGFGWDRGRGDHGYNRVLLSKTQ
jgi:hypothetical protein